MAASPPPDVSVKTTEEEMSSAMETDPCSVTEGGGEDALPPSQPETEDPFKKPALFAAPSVTSKRTNVTAPSKPAAAEPRTGKENSDAELVHPATSAGSTSTESDNESKPTDKQKEEVKDVAPVKTKPDAKPRVLPAKVPPAGKFPPLPYSEPPWGGEAPDSPYALEILKNGTIVDKIPLTHRSYYVVGRLPVCDVSLEHPSISRYHAVIQYRGPAAEGQAAGEDTGFYVHDLGSTHGTVVNKNKIPPKTYIRLRVGHVVKFGGSTRLFILQVGDGAAPLPAEVLPNYAQDI